VLKRDLHGGANKNVHAENIKDQILCLPPFEEQTYIADYLDRKTVEIDDLVAQKRRLIALLNEEKAATINRAMTKGLNPNAPKSSDEKRWVDGVLPRKKGLGF
jgi:type I restriction enzyme S subunit